MDLEDVINVFSTQIIPGREIVQSQMEFVLVTQENSGFGSTS